MTEGNRNIHALILAAGDSSRFGNIKLLAPCRGKPLIQHVVSAAEEVLPGTCHIVLGAHRDKLTPHTGNARVVENPHWEQGLASSLRAGISNLPSSAEHILLLLADQVLVTAEDIRRLIEAHKTNLNITCAKYNNTYGVPAIFAHRWFAELMTMQGDQGAKPLILANLDVVDAVSMPNAIIDIDLPQDLTGLEKQNQQNQ